MGMVDKRTAISNRRTTVPLWKTEVGNVENVTCHVGIDEHLSQALSQSLSHDYSVKTSFTVSSASPLFVQVLVSLLKTVSGRENRSVCLSAAAAANIHC